jgi:hypothetical protein
MEQAPPPFACTKAVGEILGSLAAYFNELTTRNTSNFFPETLLVFLA